MLKKRIIPCLDVKDGRTVKGVKFVGLKDAGDPVELAQYYAQSGADELVFLDISATIEKRSTLVDLVKKVSRVVNIPFAVGGGIRSIQDVSALLNAGADKVSINSEAIKNPDLINELSYEFGGQCIIVAIDSKKVSGKNKLFISGGKIETDRECLPWAKEVQERGAGEILLTSIDHDGSRDGFAIELLSQLNDALDIPIVASGGAGGVEHFYEVFHQTGVDAALAAGIFHYREVEIMDLKRKLFSQGIQVRL